MLTMNDEYRENAFNEYIEHLRTKVFPRDPVNLLEKDLKNIRIHSKELNILEDIYVKEIESRRTKDAN